MFYDNVEAILDSKESNGWNITARSVHLTVDQLRRKIAKRTLTFEECLGIVRGSESPELLAWVLSEIRPKVMEVIRKPN